MEKKIKIGLLCFVFLVLLLPLMQQNIFFIDCGKLYGYYSNAPDVDFTFEKWFDGSYQAGKDKFYNDHVGLRPYLLRLNGQIDYSLFQKIDYGGAVMGSNHYLFYDNYISAYYGKDYVGYESLSERMYRFKALQDTLARLGKSIILVYAPCKAWYFPECIPVNMRSSISRPNNYKTSVRICDSLGVNYIDLNKLFLTMKDTSKEILYAREGIHWTNYGSILGADTVIRYIEHLRGIHMPHPAWSHVLHTTQARDPDNDMGNISNLLFPVATESYCYPELFFAHDSTTTFPNMIFIGDSYSINLIRTGVMQNISREWQFWFGFNYVVNKDNYNSATFLKMDNYDWKAELAKSDCIVILNTPMNASMLGGGFIEAAYGYYYPEK